MTTGKVKKGTASKREKPLGAASETGNADSAPPPSASSSQQDPTARTCPLVLDGELSARDFTPAACMTCEEFDCPFCEAAQGSGALRSRLFDAGGTEDEADEDGWGDDEPETGMEEDEPVPDEDLF